MSKEELEALEAKRAEKREVCIYMYTGARRRFFECLQVYTSLHFTRRCFFVKSVDYYAQFFVGL